MTDIVLQLDWQRFSETLDDDVRTAMVRAINLASRKTRTAASRMVRSQVNFPATRLNEKLKVVRRASNQDLEARIEGSDRPTSLARYLSPKGQEPGKARRGGGVSISVKMGGKRKTLERAFLINLKRGTEATGNVGLAVRTDGGPPPNAYAPKEIGRNLYLVYGASVDQILVAASDGDGVFEEMTPETMEVLEAEFNRQLDLLRNANA